MLAKTETYKVAKVKPTKVVKKKLVEIQVIV